MTAFTRLSLVFLVLLHATLVTAQDSDELARRSGHPYLLYTDANIAQLKQRIENEPVVAAAWQRILATADAALAPTQQDNPRSESRQDFRPSTAPTQTASGQTAGPPDRNSGRRGERRGRGRRTNATDALLLAYHPESKNLKLSVSTQ